MGTTLIDRQFWKYTDSSYNEILPEIEELRKKYKGNYDGMFGVISNFSWTFEADGTYNIKLEIMSQGDIIESLKANLPPNNGGEKDPDKYSKIRLELLKTEATTDPDVFYNDLYPELNTIIEEYWDVLKNKSITQFNPRESAGAIFAEGLDFQLFPNGEVSQLVNSGGIDEYIGTYTNPDKNNINNVKNLFSTTRPFYYFRDILNRARKKRNQQQNTSTSTQYSSKDFEGNMEDLQVLNGNFKGGEKTKFVDGYFATSLSKPTYTFLSLKASIIKYFNTTTSTTYTLDELLEFGNPIRAAITAKWFIQNTPIELILEAAFDFAETLNLAGGADDPQFAPPTEEVDPDQLAIQNAEKKMQDNAGKNKVFSYFYKIYKFGSFEADGEASIYSNIKSFVKAAFSPSRDKITAFENEIGEVKNPRYSDPTLWNKQVGFPTYFTTNSSVDFVRLKISPIQNQHFIRFGTFLEYFEKNVIPKIDNDGTKTPPPVLKIDYNPKSNICYVIDNSISLNPNKTLISNTSFYSGTENQRIYPELNLFNNTTSEGFKYGNIMNVYFSFNRIEEIMDGVDANNQISVYKVLKSLATDINESLGNVNNIEPIIDKESNIVRFIDQTPIPGLKTIAKLIPGYEIFEKPEAILEIFGINPTNNTSNFVRSAGITTEISKEYATIITIGATANGAIPGAESTAFSKWNVGIEDRFKNKLIDGEAERGQNLEDQNARVLEKYVQFIGQKYEKLGFTQTGNDVVISSDFIKNNKSAALDYYIYAQSETSNQNSEYIESSIGFLPFNLKLSMDGLSGVKIYNKIKVNVAFLPSNYDETLSFIVTGVNHKLSNNEWVTSLDTIATTKEKQVLPSNILDTEELLNDENQPQPSSRTSEGPVAPPLTDELSEEEQLILQASAEAERIEAERIEAETAAASSFSTRQFDG